MSPIERPRAKGERSICSNSSAEIDRRFVLKPNDDYGGHGVHFGAQLDEREWDNAIETALSADYIVQDALDLHPEMFPIFSETDWKLQPMFVDTNPFLFRGKVCGAMVRLSATPIVNVTSGGGETGFFVLQEQRARLSRAYNSPRFRCSSFCNSRGLITTTVLPLTRKNFWSRNFARVRDNVSLADLCCGLSKQCPLIRNKRRALEVPVEQDVASQGTSQPSHHNHENNYVVDRTRPWTRREKAQPA